MKYLLVGIVLLVVVGLGVVFFLRENHPPRASQNISPTISILKNNAMTITSPAFQNNTSIPQKYSCEGENISPPLSFSAVPPETKSLGLLMDDPDVPKSLKPGGVFDHWVVFNIPPTVTTFDEGTTPPGVQGRNGAMKSAYTGPCPPDREHRYFFKLYALDTMLSLTDTATKNEVETAMNNHIIDQVQLIGLYDKKNK